MLEYLFARKNIIVVFMTFFIGIIRPARVSYHNNKLPRERILRRVDILNKNILPVTKISIDLAR